MRIFVIILTLFFAASVSAGPREKWYVDQTCKSVFKGQQEYHFPSGQRADCVNNKHAIEYGFLKHHWYEDLGQALHYAQMANKKPGIVFILTDPEFERFLPEIINTCKYHGIGLWTTESPDYIKPQKHEEPQLKIQQLTL